VRLHDLAELDLDVARQLEAVVGRHDVRDAALARLAVDADDRFVAAAEVFRIDRKIRNFPRRAGGLCERVEAFLDRILMRTRERGEHEVAAVRVTRVYRNLIAVLDGAHDLRDVRDVELRIDALRE